MLLPHNKVSGGVQDSQIMIPSFFDRFYVMPPLTNGVHYKVRISVRTCELTTLMGSNRVPSIRFKARFNCPSRKHEIAVFIHPALKKGCAVC